LDQTLFPITSVIVVDGDTIKGNVELPFGLSVWRIIRLKGWWAPEPAGASLHQGVAARGCLERFCEGKNLFIYCVGGRMDVYGRIVAHLWHQGAIVKPEWVLGAYQLSKERHKAIADEIRASEKLQPGQCSTPAEPEEAVRPIPGDLE
jgi:hypothetical protein